jgi:twinkle protein
MQGVTTLWGSFEIKNTRLAQTMLQQFAASDLTTQPPEVFAQCVKEPSSPLLSASGGVSSSMICVCVMVRWADQFEELPLYFMRFFGSTNVEQVIDAMEYACYVYDVCAQPFLCAVL